MEKRVSKGAVATRPSKRSALRASQGCAPDQANKQGDSVGRARWESSFLEPAGTRFFEENH